MSSETSDTMVQNPQTLDDIAAVVEHELFPDVDLALRRGRHIDREDAAWYGFLTDAQAPLERFYRRFGAELVQRTDGFFFLLPSGDKLGRRHLSPSEMLVGQGLTLLYLEPATVEQGGVTSRDQVLSQLSTSMGTEQLMISFNAKKKRMDERVAQELVRNKVSEAVRRLAGLGFVELLADERIRLRSSLMRFAEPVRGSGAELEALTRLVASGEVALTGGDVDDETDSAEGADGEAAPESRPEPPAWNEGTEWGASFDAPEGETETEAETEADSETEAETESETEAETETETDSETETETDSETEAETDSETEAETDSETEAETDSETEVEAEDDTAEER